MEQNKEMTAGESLALITETLNNNSKEITRRGGKYFILWGILLTFFSLLVYALWKSTGHAYWNNLWFAMPLVGYPLARMIRSKEEPAMATNAVSRIVSGIWTSFGVFACSVAAFSVLYSFLGNSPLGKIAVGAGLTASIVLLFGLSETISGVALKNWAIKIAGFVTGIGSLAIYYITGANEEQMFIFTLAGIVLAATGFIVKRQNK